GLDAFYERCLKWVVGHRTITIIGAFLIFVGSLTLTKFIPTEFFPTNDNGRIGVKIELPVGTRMEIARDLATKIEKEFAAKYPEINASSFTVGQADTDNTFASIQENGSHIISWNMNLVSVGKRDRGLTQIVDLMTKDLAKYPEIKKYQVLAGGSSGGIGGQAAVDIEIYGYDFNSTDKFAKDLTNKLLQLKGIATVTNSRGDYIPEYQVDFDREKLALNGLKVATASQYLRNRINGSLSSYYREAGDEYDIKVRYAPEFRESLEDIENILIYNNQGQGIRIRDLGTVVERMTPPTIERKNRERVITLSAVLANGAVLGEMAGQVQQILRDADTPAGIQTSIGGTFEDQQDTFKDLITLGIMIILLVFIVLAAQFESMTDPFIIMFSLPFAFTGVFIGLALTGTPLG
ncbi:MAG: efflux RND transporter permease subunit, partial [Bacteroidales bacterium]